MSDMEKVIEALENAEMTDGVIKMSNQFRDIVVAMLKEQEAEIRQLRLALDIAKGTCKGIAVETDEKFMGDL